MFLFLSKFLPLFIYPVGLVLILLIVAWVREGNGKSISGLLVAGIAILWLFGNGWVTAAITRSLEWKYLPEDETPHASVMVLLGGGTEPAQTPREHVEVNGAGDRIIHAALLYHAGAADKIIVSGGGVNWMDGRQVSIAEEMETLLILMGVPQSAIIQQGQSANTYEDALYSAEILEDMGVDEIILITSAMHMPRSVALFEHQGLTVVPSPTDFKVTQTGWDSIFKPTTFESVLYAFIPSVSDLGTTTAAIKEYIGMMIYSLRGWM
jgi:uncharacterized SAM-binding protein YcdF (DUF218 family)